MSNTYNLSADMPFMYFFAKSINALAAAEIKATAQQSRVGAAIRRPLTTPQSASLTAPLTQGSLVFSPK